MTTTDRPIPADRFADRLADRLARWGPALFFLALQATFAATFGIFRDELYYLACAARLDWGYVDHPPLIAVLTALWTGLFGNSVTALRVLPALAGAATVALAGSIARRMGGGNFAVAFAGLSVALSPIILGLTSVLSMNALDLLFWALALRLVVDLLDDGDPRGWLGFGAIAGLGLLNKISLLFLGFGLVAGLVLARRWAIFRNRWFWLGGVLAGLLFAPHLVWQRSHGWPTLEFMKNASEGKNVALDPLAFLGRQLLQTGPFHALVWLAGLGALLLMARMRPWRALGFAYFAILGVMLSSAAKPYYLAPVYPMLWAAGAVAIERFSARAAGQGLFRPIARWCLAGLVVLSGLAFAPLARPMLPVETYVCYARAFGEEPGTDERKSLGRLPQFFADMQEWKEMAEAVARAATRLTAEERPLACVFGENYGEAGAVEHFGRELDLPPAFSGHNNWFLWGIGRCAMAPALVILGNDRERLDKLFEEVELATTFSCRDCMPYEDNLPIWIARRPRGSLVELWPRIKHFD
ncbi:MAG: glycosyltransferase family 39 protein [Thermoanaerobaculia bacterium]